jgi:NADH dehydrogenase (ubiquinone) 1 alpha subcomplex subunit 7
MAKKMLLLCFYSYSYRTQKPPNLPDGVAHKLAANYYCNRDLRRAAAPPSVGYTSQNLLESG